MGAHKGGERVGRRPPPPGKNKKMFCNIRDFLLLFLHMNAFSQRFSHCWGPCSPCGGLSATFFLYSGGLFGLVLPLRKFMRAPMACFSDIISVSHVFYEFQRTSYFIFSPCITQFFVFFNNLKNCFIASIFICITFKLHSVD